MKNINITVSGQVGTGKSMICMLIANALQDHGFKNFTVSDDLPALAGIPMIPKAYKEVLKKVNADSFNINIRSVQEAREAL